MATKQKRKRSARKPRPIAKPRSWREALEGNWSQASYEDLAKLAQQTKTPKPLKPRTAITDLVIAEKVFQWRGKHSDLQAEEQHMRALMRPLELGRELDPITVIQLADELYVVDGHHRLAAYAAMGKKDVPAQPFKGTFEEAWLYSWDANSKDKLAPTRDDRSDAAFTFVKRRYCDGLDMTWAEIAQRAGVSEELVYKMRRTLVAALDRADKEALDWSWKKTLGNEREAMTPYRPGTEDFREEHARKMADQIMAKVKMNLTANPEITAIALRMISEELPRALIEEWGSETKEVLIGTARDLGSEKAEAAFTEGFRYLDEAKDADLLSDF